MSVQLRRLAKLLPVPKLELSFCSWPGLLAMDPSRRMTVRQALQHPYLEDCPPSPGGEMELSEFLDQFEEQTVSLEFERKDATLEFLRHSIIREVDQLNAPMLFAGQSPKAEAPGRTEHKSSSPAAKDAPSGAKAAATSAGQALRRGSGSEKPGEDGKKAAGEEAPAKEEKRNSRQGSLTTIQQLLRGNRGSASSGGEADADAKPEPKKKGLFK
jgi:hypothetical protein